MEKSGSKSSPNHPLPIKGSSAEIEKRLLDNWFPVNPQLLAKIRNNLSDGNYRDDCDTLIEHLKSDVSLFTYCLRKLIELTKENSLPENPIDLIRASSFEDLRDILSCQDEDISTHRLQDITHDQAHCIQNIIVSTSTAATLCERENLSSDLGYFCALLRQLGLTLIAWNYPHVYQRTLCTINDGDNLDEALSRYLGFSPALLGITIARKWGLSQAIRHAVGDPQTKEDVSDPQAEYRGAALERICLLGEALAQASAPDHLPLPHKDWDIAKAELERKLGTLGFELLQEKIYQASQAYLNYVPQFFETPKLEIKPPPPPTAIGLHLLTRNVYLTQCPAKLRAAIERAYAQVDDHAISKDVLISICRSIIPLGGFPRGCIYLIDPESQTLVPRLAIGTATLNDYKPIGYSSNNDNIVSKAYRSSSPMHEDKALHNGQLVLQVCGILGEVQKNGVLYVEIAESMVGQHATNIAGRFKAIKQLLCDCLNLY